MKIEIKQTTIFLTLIIIALFVLSSAQKSKIGDFDINKVREAVGSELSDSGMEPGNTDVQKEKIEPLEQSYFMVILRIIALLALLSLLILGGVWLIKRYGISGSSRIGGGSMDVLEALPIGQNKSIVLVRVLDSVYVLAQTSQQITLLEKINGDKAVELIATTKGGTSIVQFKDMFNNFMGKIKKTP